MNGTLTINLEAGIPSYIPAGRKITILEILDPINLTFLGYNNEILEEAFGISAGFTIEPEISFNRVKIESQVNQEIRVYLTSGNITSDRIVTRDTSEWYYSQTNRAFYGSAIVMAVADKHSAVQFRNPSGSNKIRIIERLTIMSLTSTNGIYIMIRDGSLFSGSTLGDIISKSGDNTIPNDCIYAVTHNNINASAKLPIDAAGKLMTITYKNRLVVPPDRSFVFSNSDYNKIIEMSFDWLELPI